ncbi:MAG: hypothetical protein RMK29_11715 [Myxococcales bacterium]|nr:hypothetical protein [Myxococcota bacterium]MDW8282375.1 hypothetical protein [Myxococcales bacterium]
MHSRFSSAQAQQAMRNMVDRALRDVALLVSARGLCARRAAELAELPRWDVDAVSSVCLCSTCCNSRLH